MVYNDAIYNTKMEWIGQEFKYTAKQDDCFNHRVVTLVADKLEK